MSARWLGIAVSSGKVVAVHAEVPSSGPMIIQSDQTWKLQTGEKPRAYSIMHQQVSDYLNENSIALAAIKASALSTGSTKLAHLEAAEVRGVVIAAAGSKCEVVLLTKAQVSRTFGVRKFDEYLEDDQFWRGEVIGNPLRTGSREAAMILLAARKR